MILFWSSILVIGMKSHGEILCDYHFMAPVLFFAKERICHEHIVGKCPTCLLQTVNIYRLYFIVNVHD